MVRFGIAGFGLHARKRLMPAFARTRRAQVVALSQRNLGRARASAAEYGIPHAFDSVEALCACPDVDAVFVATPNVCHLQDVLAAARHRKAILCEKPMAMNAVECEQMLQAARTANVLFGVAHVFRFAETVRTIRHQVQSGAVGRPYLARAEFSYPGIGHARQWILDRAVGGGMTADVGVHCIDSLRWILNDEVTQVQALMTFDKSHGDADLAGALNLRFRSGLLAQVYTSIRVPYRTSFQIECEKAAVECSNALALADPGAVRVLRDSQPVEERNVSNEEAFVQMIEAFADAFEGKAPFPAPAEEGWRNQLILDAAYQSAATGNTVTLDGQFPGNNKPS